MRTNKKGELMTTTNTDTRTAHLMTCEACKFAGIVEPRAMFPRTWWVVTEGSVTQSRGRTAGEDQIRDRHSRRCCFALNTEPITDYRLPENGAQHYAVFAGKFAR